MALNFALSSESTKLEIDSVGSKTITAHTSTFRNSAAPVQASLNKTATIGSENAKIKPRIGETSVKMAAEALR